MEMIFRKIEYLIDGDSAKQKALDIASWNGEKILKRSGKFVAFFLVSYIIANYFLSYIVGMDQVVLLYKEGVGKHVATFIPMYSFLFTGGSGNRPVLLFALTADCRV